MTTTPEQMQRILETLFPRSKYATQPAPVETKVEVKIDDKKTTEAEEFLTDSNPDNNPDKVSQLKENTK